MQLRRVAPRTSREYRKVFLTSATVVMLLLTLVILLQGVNALFLPPSWVPRLLYVVLMLFLTMSVLHTVAGYAGNLQQMSPTDRRTELRRTLHGTQGIILSIGVVCMLVLVPIASMWRAQPPTFDWMRLAYGVGFAPASFARLDALGYVFGALLLLLPILGCSCFFCQFLQVGRAAPRPANRANDRPSGASRVVRPPSLTWSRTARPSRCSRPRCSSVRARAIQTRREGGEYGAGGETVGRQRRDGGLLGSRGQHRYL